MLQFKLSFIMQFNRLLTDQQIVLYLATPSPALTEKNTLNYKIKLLLWSK